MDCSAKAKVTLQIQFRFYFYFIKKSAKVNEKRRGIPFSDAFTSHCLEDENRKKIDIKICSALPITNRPRRRWLQDPVTQSMFLLDIIMYPFTTTGTNSYKKNLSII